MPAVFNTDIDTVPSRIPYLRAWDWEVEKMLQRHPRTGNFRVGIAWAGNPRYKADRVRSFSLMQFAALAHLEGVEWYSMQKGPGARQIEKYAELLPVIDASSDARDFAESAALMETMDLIITSDTSVAHLAGALGKPVWMLLAHLPDWRWMMRGESCPWYPSMRLFRQTRLGDWPSVFARVEAQLRRTLELYMMGRHEIQSAVGR